MNLEVGMYARTLDGIMKIVEVKNSGILTRVVNEDGNVHFIYDLIGNPSHNIIDLIKPNDLMYIDISPDDCGGIIVPRIAETLAELERWKKHFSTGYWILKGVVTYEQIEPMVYKVGD